MKQKDLQINIAECLRCGKYIDNTETDICFECSQEEGWTGEDTT